MHPFLNWLKINNHVIPFKISDGVSEWFNIENGDTFSEYLNDQNIGLEGITVKRLSITDTTHINLMVLFAQTFGGEQLAELQTHSKDTIKAAEQKRHLVLKGCDDLLAMYICSQDYINQVQFWALRKQASTNAILMNIASITIITSLAQRCMNQQLTDEELQILNNDIKITWEDIEQVKAIQDRLMSLLIQLVGFKRVAFKDLTIDQINNPENSYKELTKPFTNLKIVSST